MIKKIILKAKNKLGLKNRSKNLVLGLILLALIGFLSIAEKTEAQIADNLVTCVVTGPKGEYVGTAQVPGKENCETGFMALLLKKEIPAGSKFQWSNSTVSGACIDTRDNRQTSFSEQECKQRIAQGQNFLSWKPQWIPESAPAQPNSDKSPFENQISENKCSMNPLSNGTFWPGCFIQFFYGIFYVIPSFLLYVCAKFFDVLVAFSLRSSMFNQPFVSAGWGVVRDVSNIFFIIALLYIAIQIILDLGHGAKKMIAYVIIMALLINFSLFFTKVVIDSTNLLALVFYNKLNVTDPQGKVIADEPFGGEKTIAGALTASFNPTKLLTKEFFETAKEINAVPGVGGTTNGKVSAGIIIGITIIAGLLMFFACYAFFVCGFAFVARLIELWLLMIFSPFAFMSFSVDFLKKTPEIGWGSWFTRLTSSAFMAPIFMFFLYFIFLMLHKGEIFAGFKADNEGFLANLLLIIIPAILICVLLLQAIKFAKKGSGVIGDALMKGAKIAGGAALGIATGGTAMLAANTLGRGAANLAESNKFKDWAATSKIGAGALRATSALGAASFDARGIKVAGKTLGGALPVGKAKEGGFKKARDEAVKRKEEFANKMIDTSDYGKAELARGGMSRERAQKLMKQMREGGMSEADSMTYYLDLVGKGVQSQDLSNVARHINSARRNTYADRLEKREKGWSSEAKTWGVGNAKRRIAANKIRKDAKTQKEESSVAHALAHIAHEVGGAHDTPAAHPTPAHPPAAAPAAAAHPPEGEAGHGGGEH